MKKYKQISQGGITMDSIKCWLKRKRKEEINLPEQQKLKRNFNKRSFNY
jgi:hypothetical protein